MSFVNYDIPTSIQGLENLGNTCYMNAIMQCLANCDTLLHSVLSSNHRKACSVTSIDNNDMIRETNSKGRPDICVQCAFETCILHMKYPSVFQNNIDQYNNTADCYNLTTQFYKNHPLIHIINILPFISLEFGRQEDAHEFLLNLLLCIERSDISSVSISPSSSSPYAGSIFGSSLISSITCFDCSAISTKSEQIQDIQLEISKAATLQTAMIEYCKLENLVGSESYFCSRCNHFSSFAQKCLQLESLSDLVRLQLKRFAFDASTGKAYKLGHYVEYPSFFDFGPHIIKKQGKSSEPLQYYTPTKDSTSTSSSSSSSSSKGKHQTQSTVAMYELVSLVVHSGKSPQTGHYIAYVKSKAGRWMMVNDDKVTVVSTEEALQQYAYILFYQRVSSPTSTVAEVPSKMLYKEDRSLQRSQFYGFSGTAGASSNSGEFGHPSALKNRSIRIYRTPNTVQSLPTRPMTDSSPCIPRSEDRHLSAVAQTFNGYNQRDGWAFNKNDTIPPQEEEPAMYTPHEVIEKATREPYDTNNTSGKKRKLHADSFALTDSDRWTSVADGSSSITNPIAPQRLYNDGSASSVPADDSDDNNNNNNDGEIFSPKKRPALRPMYSLTSFLSGSLSAATTTATATMMMMMAKRPNKQSDMKDTNGAAVNEGGNSKGVRNSWMKLFRGDRSSSSSSKYQVGEVVVELKESRSESVNNEATNNLRNNNPNHDKAIRYAIGSSTNHFQDRDRHHTDRDRVVGDRSLHIPTSHYSGQNYHQPTKNAMQQRSSGVVSRVAPSNKRRVDVMMDYDDQNPSSVSGPSSSKRTNSGSVPPAPSIIPSSKLPNGILQVVSNAFSNILFVPDATDDD